MHSGVCALALRGHRRRRARGASPEKVRVSSAPAFATEPHPSTLLVVVVVASLLLRLRARRSGVVRVWNMDTGFEQALEGHVGGIYCMAQGGAYLFSGGDDTGVKTWHYDTDQFKPLTELKGHQAPVQVMKTTSAALITADRGGTVAKWDLEKGTLLSTIATGHTNHLMALWVEDSFLFTAALDGHVKVWDSEGNMQYDQVRLRAFSAYLLCPRARACCVLVRDALPKHPWWVCADDHQSEQHAIRRRRAHHRAGADRTG